MSMETTPSSADETPVWAKRTRRKFVLVFLSVSSGILFYRSIRFLAGYQGPWTMKLGVVLAAWPRPVEDALPLSRA